MKRKIGGTVEFNSAKGPSAIGFDYAPAFSDRAAWRAMGRLGSAGLKRGVDIVGAALLLVFFLPFFILIAVAIKAIHGGPVFFRQDRIGMGGRMFPCLKFRSMHCDADRRLAACLAADPARRLEWAKDRKLRRDPRVLFVGRFLRKSSLDELPQLLNVLRGDMSLVGPRPIVRDETKHYGDDFVYYLSLRPGITGLWQVSGRNDTTYAERVAFDVRYARGRTLMGDLAILLRTVVVVTTGRGAY